MSSYDDRLADLLRRLGWDEGRVGRELTRQRRSRRLYHDQAGEPILRESYAVYLDALGTKVRMPTLDDERLREDLALLRYRWFLHDDDEEWEPSWQRMLSFTDNVIVGSPVVQDERGEAGYALGMLIDSIRAYQMNMTARGSLLRGAVTRGPLYMDDRYVTGSALVEAVQLEGAARVPRVVLGQSCVASVLALRGDWAWDDALLVDGDGQVFVNYLKVIDEDELSGDVERGLAAHQAMIEARLHEFQSEGSIRDKYRWAAEYHNFVAVEYFDLDEYLVADGLSDTERSTSRQFRRLP